MNGPSRKEALIERSSLSGLESWYAERGSRDMAYRRPLPPLRLVCACGEPARKAGGGAVACSACWPRNVS